MVTFNSYVALFILVCHQFSITIVAEVVGKERKEMFYLTTHTAHFFIYSYMALDSSINVWTFVVPFFP